MPLDRRCPHSRSLTVTHMRSLPPVVVRRPQGVRLPVLDWWAGMIPLMQVPAVSPARRAVLEEVAARLPDRAPDGVRVGIDGVDGVGKTTFADHLAAVLQHAGRSVVRVSADDFHHPREVRYRRAATRRRVSGGTATTTTRCGGGSWSRSAPAAHANTKRPVMTWEAIGMLIHRRCWLPRGPCSSSTDCSCIVMNWLASGICRSSCRRGSPFRWRGWPPETEATAIPTIPPWPGTSKGSGCTSMPADRGNAPA